MTPEQAAAVIEQLNAFDYTAQADRNQAAQLIQSLQAQGNLPPDVSVAVGEAFQRLNAGGGVAGQEVFEFRRFSDLAAGVMDQLGTFLGVLDEMDTTAGKRYTEALVTASLSGDPAALRRLSEIMEDEGTSERTQLEVGGAIERVTAEFEGQRDPQMRPAAADIGGGDADGATPAVTPEDADTGAPLAITAADIAALLGSGGGSAYYGVPDQTGTGETWEALVGDTTVAPQYPTGWSLQPQRFGLVNEESIARAQILMEDAGLLEAGSYRIGVWDPATAGRGNTSGWSAVLSFANVTGTSWETAFSRLYDVGTDAYAQGIQLELERLNRTPFFADQEKLRDRTRNFMRSMGRRESEITEEELDQITQMAAVGGQRMQTEVLTSRVERQGQIGPQGQTALEALSGGDLPVAPLSEPELDPVAAFDSALRNVMGREIESREAQEQGATGSRQFSRIAGTLGSAG